MMSLILFGTLLIYWLLFNNLNKNMTEEDLLDLVRQGKVQSIKIVINTMKNRKKQKKNYISSLDEKNNFYTGGTANFSVRNSSL